MGTMTPQEQAEKIEEIYNEAIAKLDTLVRERQAIVQDYINELEAHKLSAVRRSLGLQDTK